MNYEARLTGVVVLPEGESIFADSATTIKLEDESGGEFVVVSQQCGDYGKIGIEAANWPAIRDAIDLMIGKCRP